MDSKASVEDLQGPERTSAPHWAKRAPELNRDLNYPGKVQKGTQSVKGHLISLAFKKDFSDLWIPVMPNSGKK